MKCRFFKRDRGSSSKNVCMAEMAILGEAGDTYCPADSEAIDICLSEVEFKNCNRFNGLNAKKTRKHSRTRSNLNPSFFSDSRKENHLS